MLDHQAPPATADPAPGSARPGGRTFGQWLDRQLRARRLTQRQLAQKAGVHHSTISRLMRGSRVPSLRTANLLARSLGMPDGLAGLDRQGPERAQSPAARVEYALRLDDDLSDAQVRSIMNVYLSARRRHLG